MVVSEGVVVVITEVIPTDLLLLEPKWIYGRRIKLESDISGLWTQRLMRSVRRWTEHNFGEKSFHSTSFKLYMVL